MSSTLWAHLLNKDATVSGPGLKTGLAAVGLTASAPPDKAGTSVRILLHDTQATIEKFSERVDKLVSDAEDSRQKLLARNEEVNDEVERLVRRVIQERGVLFLRPEIASKTLILSDSVLSGYTLSNPCAYIDPIFRHRQWAERKQHFNHLSVNRLKHPLSQNYGSQFRVP